MTERSLIVFAMLLLGGIAVADADQLEKGDFEVGFRLSYSDLDFDGPGGDSDSKEFVGSFGYLLTDHHELGAGVGYFGSGSFDTVEYGGSYSYNFRAGQSLNPYLGALILGFGGDRADVFDLGYAVELGVKFYPGSHGGMLFGVTYRQLTGANKGPDASNVIAFGGLTLKF